MAAQPQAPQIAHQENKLFVAAEILAQLGGKRFLLMTGSHGLVGCAGGTTEQPNPWLRMELGAGVKEDRQRLLITLMPNDLYDVDFYTPRVINDEYEIKEKWLHFTHVYGEDLQGLFTEHTGFLTSL